MSFVVKPTLNLVPMPQADAIVVARNEPFDKAHDQNHPASKVSDVGYEALTHAETPRPKGTKSKILLSQRREAHKGKNNMEMIFRSVSTSG